jgi:hypothetical protein
MPDTLAQGASIPVEVRKQVREWLLGTYGVDHIGVPLRLIELVVKSGSTIYRLEIDVMVVTSSPRRATVYLEVSIASGSAPVIDPDTVVFFDE